MIFYIMTANMTRNFPRFFILDSYDKKKAGIVLKKDKL